MVQKISEHTVKTLIWLLINVYTVSIQQNFLTFLSIEVNLFLDRQIKKEPWYLEKLPFADFTLYSTLTKWQRDMNTCASSAINLRWAWPKRLDIVIIQMYCLYAPCCLNAYKFQIKRSRIMPNDMGRIFIWIDGFTLKSFLFGFHLTKIKVLIFRSKNKHTHSFL